MTFAGFVNRDTVFDDPGFQLQLVEIGDAVHPPRLRPDGFEADLFRMRDGIRL